MDEDTSCDRNDRCKHVFNGCKDGARIPCLLVLLLPLHCSRRFVQRKSTAKRGARARVEVGAVDDDDDDDDDDGFLLSFIDDDALIVLYKLSRVLFLEELAMDGRADGDQSEKVSPNHSPTSKRRRQTLSRCYAR